MDLSNLQLRARKFLHQGGRASSREDPYTKKKFLEPVINSRPALTARDKAVIRQRVTLKLHETRQTCLKTQLKGKKERRGRRIKFCYLTRRGLEAGLTAV